MNSPAKRLTIGIRDSGAGGLTVARRVLEKLPAANLLYFADTAHVPYGEKSVEQVRFFALSISQFLINQGAQMVVFACNTTSACALEAARECYCEPIFGVIEPGARHAARISSGHVGVLATTATVRSAAYSRVLKCLRPALKVTEIACPLFVPLVEGHNSEGAEAAAACRQYLEPLRQSGVDTIVLGCTHFPLLLPLLQASAPEINFVDPAGAVADEVGRYLNVNELYDEGARFAGEPQRRFFASGPDDGLSAWISSLLGFDQPKIEYGPVFDFPSA